MYSPHVARGRAGVGSIAISSKEARNFNGLAGSCVVKFNIPIALRDVVPGRARPKTAKRCRSAPCGRPPAACRAACSERLDHRPFEVAPELVASRCAHQGSSQNLESPPAFRRYPFMS